jgi:hypothetical protein
MTGNLAGRVFTRWRPRASPSVGAELKVLRARQHFVEAALVTSALEFINHAKPAKFQVIRFHEFGNN